MSEHRSSLSAARWHSFSRNLSRVRALACLGPARLALGPTTAVLIGLASPALAQIFWSDDDPDVYIEAPPPPPPPAKRREPHRAKPHRLAKSESAAKGARKPKGPLIVAISIRQQTLKIYDANGFFAETPVSTGSLGRSTPLGVFSVIQKQKWHRSNIYSGAPMPYMQRITWSGIAMHAGVLPGYPASHGCIRMPMNFAVKMWGWTRMGARVIITPGEVTPAKFLHPMLITHRPEPAPVAADVRTADASDAMPQVAVSSVAADSPAADAATSPEPRQGPETTVPADMSEFRAALEPESMFSEPGPDQPKPAAMAEDASSGINSAGTGPNEIDPAGSAVHSNASDSMSGPQTAATGSAADPIKPATGNAMDADVTAATSVKPDADKAKNEDEPQTTGVPATAADQSQSSRASAMKTNSVAIPAPKRSGRIAVFVSRKDSKIYVRQNFEPLFDAPITIAASDRPWGTHVFTAEADKDSKDNFHWSVVSLPAMVHRPEQVSVGANPSPRRKAMVYAESRAAPVPDSAADVLDRISIPQAVMTKIAGSLSTGDSIIVSDQGIAGGETGEGTDFIVRLH